MINIFYVYTSREFNINAIEMLQVLHTDVKIKQGHRDVYAVKIMDRLFGSQYINRLFGL